MTSIRTETTEAESAPIRIFFADDHAFLVEGLSARFGDAPDFEVVGTLGSAEDLVAMVEERGADVVLLDIEMPGRDIFDAIDELNARVPGTRAGLLSGHVRQTYLDMAVKAGAWGYLSKRDAPNEIVDAVRHVCEGRFAFSPEVTSKCGLDPFAGESAPNRDRVSSRLGRLTPRELQILRMIGRGMPRNEIASAIPRSPKTVDAHRSSIMDKLNLHDRVELARFAIREGLVEL